MTDPLAGLKLVKDEIDKALVVHCEQCYSIQVWPRTEPGPRGAVIRWDHCTDCGNNQNVELEAP